MFHTLSSRDAARAGLARRPTRFLAGLYEYILSGEESEANAARPARSKSQQKGCEISGLGNPRRGIRGPVRPAPDIRRFALPFWSTLSTTHPLIRMAPLKCIFAPTDNARAGRAPGFNGIVPEKRHWLIKASWTGKL